MNKGNECLREHILEDVMAKKGRLKPKDWGSLMPVHNPQAPKAPYYYRDTEMVMAHFETDAEACLDILPSDLELYEPATAFMIMERNHWTSNGGYDEVYIGIVCTYEGEVYAYCPGVYVSEENAQVLGREIWGFGKKMMSGFDIKTHGNGTVEVKMDVLPGDGALRCTMRPDKNEPPESLAGYPIVCLKVIPDAEGSDTPALAQLVAVSFAASALMGSDGKAEVFSGEGELTYGCTSDIKFPVKNMVGCTYARFNADLPYGKILKTYTKNELP